MAVDHPMLPIMIDLLYSIFVYNDNDLLLNILSPRLDSSAWWWHCPFSLRSSNVFPQFWLCNSWISRISWDSFYPYYDWWFKSKRTTLIAFFTFHYYHDILSRFYASLQLLSSTTIATLWSQYNLLSFLVGQVRYSITLHSFMLHSTWVVCWLCCFCSKAKHMIVLLYLIIEDR